MKPYYIALLLSVCLLVLLFSTQSDTRHHPLDPITDQGAKTADNSSKLSKPEESTGPNLQEKDEPRQIENHVPDRPVTLREYAESRGLILIGKNQEEETNGLGRFHETDLAIYAGTNDLVIQLIDSLNDSDSEKRGDTLDTLLSEDIVIGEKLEPLLVHYLRNDPAASVRAAAARALEDGETPSSIAALIDSLEDEDISVRENARGTLGMIRGPVVRFKLKERLSEKDSPESREIIVEILEDVFDEPLWIDE